jgi:hypothetical protein
LFSIFQFKVFFLLLLHCRSLALPIKRKKRNIFFRVFFHFFHFFQFFSTPIRTFLNVLRTNFVFVTYVAENDCQLACIKWARFCLKSQMVFEKSFCPFLQKHPMYVCNSALFGHRCVFQAYTGTHFWK